MRELCDSLSIKTIMFVMLLLLLLGTEYYLYTHGYGVLAMLGVLLLPP